MTQYDYSRLLGRMKERGFTQNELSKRLGMCETTLNLSLNNRRDFKQEEMLCACEVLNIPTEKIPDYFFTHKL